MAFHPFEVTPVHLAYTILGAIIVLFGMFSLFIKEKLYVGEAVVSTLVGIIAGPYVTGGFNPRAWGGPSEEITTEITLEITRVVLALSVFATGVELPKAYVLKHWKSILFLLGPCMVWGWFVVAGFIVLLVPGLSFLSSLVVASCLTPTDPILAQAVIGGAFAEKHVPAHIRHLLAVESGCNDGAAFPFLFIAIYLTLDASDSHAVGDWFAVTWCYEVILGIILGSLLGYAARKLFQFCEKRRLIDRQSFVAQYVSLAILSIGILTLLGSDDLLAAFACGTAFAWDGFFNKQTEESNFSNVIDLLFNITCFIYIGSIIPFDRFNDHELTLVWWKLVLLVIAVVVLRRLPVMMALWKWIPDIRTYREALFVGHFGPMGVGAIFISNLASTRLPEPVYPPENQVEMLAATIQPIVHFIVLGSVLIHGLSIPFFSLGRRVHSISRTHSIAFTRTNDSRMSRMRSRSMDDGARRGRDRDDRPEPSWLSDMKRVVPGQAIVINRDDDDEAIDLKQIRPVGREKDEGDLEKGKTVGSTDSSSSTAGGSGSGRNFEKEAKEADEEKEREFREGNALVTETQDDDGDVDVSVDDDHFSNSSHREGMLKRMMESREDKDRRLAQEDEDDERKAYEDHHPRRSRSASPEPKPRTGGGVSMMRTATIIDGDEAEEVSSDDEGSGNEDSPAGSTTGRLPRIAISNNDPSPSSSKPTKKWKKLFGGASSSSPLASPSIDSSHLVPPTIKTSRSPSASSGTRSSSIRFTDSLPTSFTSPSTTTSYPPIPSSSLLSPSPSNTLDGPSPPSRQGSGTPSAYQSILLDADEAAAAAGGGGEGGDAGVTFDLPKPKR